MKNRKTFHHVGKYLLTGAAALLCGPLFAAELAEAGVRITPEGDLLDSKGNPRAWIGTDCSGGSVSQPERGGKAFRGRYNDKYRWIYETNVTAPQLHRLGFLDIASRRGVTVADYAQTGSLETLRAIMDFHGGLPDAKTAGSILQLRYYLEGPAMEELAARHTPADMAAL